MNKPPRIFGFFNFIVQMGLVLGFIALYNWKVSGWVWSLIGITIVFWAITAALSQYFIFDPLPELYDLRMPRDASVVEMEAIRNRMIWLAMKPMIFLGFLVWGTLGWLSANYIDAFIEWLQTQGN